MNIPGRPSLRLILPTRNKPEVFAPVTHAGPP